MAKKIVKRTDANNETLYFYTHSDAVDVGEGNATTSLTAALNNKANASDVQALSDDALRKSPQSLSSQEKEQVHNNIGTESFVDDRAVRYDDVQVLSSEEKAQALTNLGLNGVDDEPTPNSDNLVKSGGVQNELALGAVYDVSAKNPTAGSNNDGKFESLSALLSDANINTLIPIAVRKGGMSVKFVLSSDNKYVQYFLTKDEWSASEDDWEKMNLEEEVSQLEGVLNIGLVPGVSDHTIENNDFTNEGFFVNTDGILTSGASWKTTPFIPIVQGTPITAKLTNGGGAAVMAFYSSDNEGSFVSYWNGNTGNEVSSNVPQNATFFRACTGKNTIYLADAFVSFKQASYVNESIRIRDIEETIQGLEVDTQTFDEKIQGIEEALDYDPGKRQVEITIGDEDFTVDGNYIKTDGTLVSNLSWKTTPFIIVKPGTPITAKLTNGSGNTGIAFYSSDNEESFISMWNGNTGSEVSGTVPDGANYFRACTGKGSLAIDSPFVKYKKPSAGSGVIEEIKESISDIEDDIEGINSKLGPVNTGKSWCSIGDSITWLNDNIGGRPLTKGYQDVVREKLTFTHFYNRGLSGYTAIGYSADSILNNLEVADFYTIFLGINDWGNTNLSQVGTMEDYKNFTTGTATNYAQAIKKIVTKCKTLNANSIILLFTPRRGKNFNGFLPSSSLSPNDAGIYLHEFADIIRQVSEYEGMALIDLYYHSGVNDANLSAFSYDDALHPNDAGMRIIGQMLYDKIKDFVL